MQKFPVEDHEPSFLPNERNWKLVWADEFDGTELDRSKWDYRLFFNGARHECRIDNGVTLDGNSNAVFHLVEKDGQYYCSTIQTGSVYSDKPNGEVDAPEPKFLHGYGYYECRFKSQNEEPWWSAFWLKSPTAHLGNAPEVDGVEIDIMEIFDPHLHYPHMIHKGIPSKNNYQGYMAEGNAENWKEFYGNILLKKDAYHRYGCHWEKDGFTFYVDGMQVGKKITEVTTPVKCFINLGTESKGYRGEAIAEPGMAKKLFPSGLKDRFIVDYVRVFDEI